MARSELAQTHHLLATVPLLFSIALGAEARASAIGWVALTIIVLSGGELLHAISLQHLSYVGNFLAGSISLGFVLLALPVFPHRTTVAIVILALAAGALRLRRPVAGWASASRLLFWRPLRDVSSPNRRLLYGVLGVSLLICARPNPVLLIPSIACGVLAAVKVHRRSHRAIVLAGVCTALVIARRGGRTLAGLNNDQIWDTVSAVGFARWGVNTSITQIGTNYSYYKFGHLPLGVLYDAIGVEPVLEGVWLTTFLTSLVVISVMSLAGTHRPARDTAMATAGLLAGVSVPEPYALDRRHTVLFATLLLLATVRIVAASRREPLSAMGPVLGLLGFTLMGSRSAYVVVGAGAVLGLLSRTRRARGVALILCFALGSSAALAVFFGGAFTSSAPLANLTSTPVAATSAWSLVAGGIGRLLPELLSLERTGATRTSPVTLPLVGSAVAGAVTWLWIPRHPTQSDLVTLSIVLAGISLVSRVPTSQQLSSRSRSIVVYLGLGGAAGFVFAALRHLTQFRSDLFGEVWLTRAFGRFQPDAWTSRFDISTALAACILVTPALVVLCFRGNRGARRRERAAVVALGTTFGTALAFAAAPALSNVRDGDSLLGHRNDVISELLERDLGSIAIQSLNDAAEAGDVVAASTDSRDPQGIASSPVARVAYLTRRPSLMELPGYGSQAADRLAHGADESADPLVAEWSKRIKLVSTVSELIDPSVVEDLRSYDVRWLVRRPTNFDTNDLPPGIELFARDDRFEVWQIGATPSG